MITSGKWFLRFQPRYKAWYVVCGLTPHRLSGCKIFFSERADALFALREHGFELKPDSQEELQRIPREIADDSEGARDRPTRGG